MKYIIEFEDKPSMREDGVNYYTCKSARWYNLGDTIINRLEPYTEPDRKVIEDEVWEFAWKMFNMDMGEYKELFDDNECPSDYREAKAKYEAWLKQKDGLRVGDVVVYADDPDKEKMVVLRLYQPPQYKPIADVLCEDGTVVKTVVVKNLVWTGRHFSEIEELLKKMRGEV